MFEEEAEEYKQNNIYNSKETGNICIKSIEEAFQDGATLGYNKGKEELAERLDNATEIIELMKDLFFDCWQEKGLKAIEFEQRVNDFLKGK